MIKVATLYRLKDRQKGEYQVSGTKGVERAAMKVEQSFIDETNRNTGSSGLHFVIDEDASAQFAIDREVNDKRVIENNKVLKAGLTKEAQDIVIKNSDKESKPKFNWGVKKLTEYANENGIELEDEDKHKDIWAKVKETL